MRKDLINCLIIVCSMMSCTGYHAAEEIDAKNQPVDYTKANCSLIDNSLSGDITVLESVVTVTGDIVSNTFIIESPVEGSYFLSLFMFPEDESTYTITCNGRELGGSIIPKKKGWQAIQYTDESGSSMRIPLKSGKNEVRVYSSSNDFPEIEIFRMTLEGEDSFISTEAYDNYLETIEKGEVRNERLVKMKSPSITISNAVVGYQYELDCPLLYSFTKQIVLTSNGNITIRTSGSSGAYPFYVDVFKDWVYTQSMLMTSSSDVFSVSFPAGTYTIHLRRYLQNNASTSMIQVQMNGHYYNYSSCPVSGYNYDTQSDGYTGGQVNYFTCNNSLGTNPIMYLEDGSGHSISSTNDDYSGSGDFDWGYNSRIKKTYTGSPLVHIFNASASLPVGACDMYVRIPTQSITQLIFTDGSGSLTTSLQMLFPSIKQDDIMLSGSSTTLYNCIGWAGDIIDWVWPLNSWSPYYVEGVSDLGLFDLYFMDRGYIRSTTPTTNDCIALWGNNYQFTHASIRKNAVSIYPHGYSWESKLGGGPRIFHAEYSLNSNVQYSSSYGEIKYYYHPISQTSNSQRREVENYSISDSARSILHNLISRNRIEGQDRFDELYQKWEAYCLTPQVQIQSDPEVIINDTSFQNLVEFCIANEELSILLIIDRLFNNDLKSGFLLDKVLPQRLNGLKDKACLRYNSNEDLVPTMYGNFCRFAEAYIETLK